MYTLSCKDQGVDCPFVAKGATKEEAMKESMAHAVQKHGMDPQELSKMDVWKKAEPLVKETIRSPAVQSSGQSVRLTNSASQSKDTSPMSARTMRLKEALIRMCSR